MSMIMMRELLEFTKRQNQNYPREIIVSTDMISQSLDDFFYGMAIVFCII